MNCELWWRFFVSFFILTCWLEGLLAVQMQNNSQKKTPGVPNLNTNQTNQNFTSANALGCLKGAIQTVKENLCLEWVLILTLGLDCQPKMFCFLLLWVFPQVWSLCHWKNQFNNVFVVYLFYSQTAEAARKAQLDGQVKLLDCLLLCFMLLKKAALFMCQT